ncbi:MAG: hypothetical protein Q8R78_00205 [Candidatus Omnitrophota bacterium]|nr:hypothetical protein [Candidatus Omnitrophota bacterium]
MRRLVWSLLLVGCLVPSGSAAHKPGKHDEGQGVEQKVERAAKQVAEEAVDAVADELLDDKGRVTRSGPGSLPPGLAKKGKMPPGLEKQGKTPPGWSQGKKTGWDKDQPPRESLVRRVIRKIFRRATEPAQPVQPQPANQ